MKIEPTMEHLNSRKEKMKKKVLETEETSPKSTLSHLFSSIQHTMGLALIEDFYTVSIQQKQKGKQWKETLACAYLIL